MELLDKYPECFSDDPGFCSLAQPEINLLSDFKPRRLKAYRVPEKLKPLVKQEIKRMLDLGVIRPSNSDMVNLLVVCNPRATKGWVVATHPLRFSASCG